jgi:hypothetical protein
MILTLSLSLSLSLSQFVFPVLGIEPRVLIYYLCNTLYPFVFSLLFTYSLMLTLPRREITKIKAKINEIETKKKIIIIINETKRWFFEEEEKEEKKRLISPLQI